MSITPFQTLACPLDGTPLHSTGSAWACASGHSFDIAGQGYTHLLPVQHKRSRDPGDSKEMVAARRRFLTAGFYQPIAAAVSQAVLANLPADASISCLDAGCGEGYYMRQLAAAVGDEQTLALLGLDISKWAVLSAAKQDKRPNWVVGSNANLPVLPGTLDRVLCMFGFPVYAEFARVLKPDGRLLQVDAGPDHLRELREIIYPTVRRSPPPPLVGAEAAGYRLQREEGLRFSVTLTGTEMIQDLVAMTPHAHRVAQAGRKALAELRTLPATVDVAFRLLALERP